MEIYLNNDNFSFRLPVLPSTINIQDYSIMNDSNITGLGDVTIFGGKGLRTTELTSFFPNPNRNYKFVSYTNYPNPWDCVTKIKDWMDTGEILRFIITDTEINFQVRISDFQYSQQDGTGDIYFTINLKEYREIKITTEQVETPTENKEREDTKEKNTDINNQNNNKDDKNSTLIISNAKETIYKVQEGDTLFDISKKFYGNGNDYKKIIESNKEKYPSLLKVSEVKTGWELILV